MPFVTVGAQCEGRSTGAQGSTRRGQEVGGKDRVGRIEWTFNQRTQPAHASPLGGCQADKPPSLESPAIVMHWPNPTGQESALGSIQKSLPECR